jgi:DNA-binding transcriptional regulator LsrR (DeoR family)
MSTDTGHQVVSPLAREAPPELRAAPTLEQTVRVRHEAGHSQRAIARELNIDRRKVKRILDRAA